MPQLLKGPCDKMAFALHATGRLAAGMGMEPDQHSLFQALLERCSGLLIALPTRPAPQLEARDLACLVDTLPHGAPACVPMREQLDGDMAQPLLSLESEASSASASFHCGLLNRLHGGEVVWLTELIGDVLFDFSSLDDQHVSRRRTITTKLIAARLNRNR